MPYIRVLEVATFYTMFNSGRSGATTSSSAAPRPARSAARTSSRRCCGSGSATRAKSRRTAHFTWQEVECLGACCNAPMVQINDDYYEDLTPEILCAPSGGPRGGRAGRAAGSQQGRNASEPAGQVDTLQDPALFDGSVIGAWRRRFEEETPQQVQAERRADQEAASTTARAATEPRVAKPDAGRAIERPVGRRAGPAGGREPGAAARARAVEHGRSEPRHGRARRGSAGGPPGAGGAELLHRDAEQARGGPPRRRGARTGARPTRRRRR